MTGRSEAQPMPGAWKGSTAPGDWSWSCLEPKCLTVGDAYPDRDSAGRAWRAHWMVAHWTPSSGHRSRPAHPVKGSAARQARDGFLAERETMKARRKDADR